MFTPISVLRSFSRAKLLEFSLPLVIDLQWTKDAPCFVKTQIQRRSECCDRPPNGSRLPSIARHDCAPHASGPDSQTSCSQAPTE